MKKNYPLPSVVVRKSTTTKTTKTTILFIPSPKMLSKVVVKKNTTTKDNDSLIPS